MESDECDLYELKKNKKLCNHFVGNTLNNKDILHCRNHCSYFESIELMQGKDRQPIFRHKGALRQARNK